MAERGEKSKKRNDRQKKQKKKRRSRWYRAGLAISFSLSLTTHFYDTMIAGYLCLGIAAGYFFRIFRWRYLRQVVLAGFVSILLAVIPMGIGVAMGNPLQGSLGWGLNVIKGKSTSDSSANAEVDKKVVTTESGKKITIVGDVDEETIEEIKKQGMHGVEEVTRLVSKQDGTNKFLFRLQDGNVLESVLMRYKHGNSVCISSQVGCRMGCRFCASTIGGLIRNLEASEMLDQIYAIERITGERVSNIVVMGTGEPLDNYDNLIRFIRIINDERGKNISQRNITVSSCGLVPQIEKLADEELSITFALSLHSPTDEDRRKLLPIANKYSIAELMEVCRYYFEKTGRRVTFEYSLVKDENDTPEHAYKLAELLKNMHGHVNLIPVNPIKEREYCRSLGDSVEKFKYILEKKDINVTIRRSMGRDIDAACGQLRRKYEEAKETF